MISYCLEKKKGRPLYESLRQSIRKDILSGSLHPGQSMPSRRVLARQLGISPITVERAYRELVAEGYLEAVERKGHFVGRLQSPPPSISGRNEEDASNPAPAADAALRESPIAPKPPAATSLHAPDPGSRNMPRGSFPCKTWARIARDVLLDNEETLLSAAPSQGSLRLREAICEHVKLSRGIAASPAQVIVGGGAQSLYTLLGLFFKTNCKGIAVENPGYPVLSKTYNACGLPVFAINIDEKGLSAEALRKAPASVVHVAPSHQFPTGLLMPISRRYELLSWASEAEDRCIVEDDYDCELRLSGRPIPSLSSIDTEGNVIYMNTFSKSLLGSMRIAYMILPERLVDSYQSKLDFVPCAVSSLEQETLARFIEQGELDRHTRKTRRGLKRCLDAVASGLREGQMPVETEMENTSGGFFFFLRLPPGADEAQVKSALIAKGVEVATASDYRIDSSFATGPSIRSIDNDNASAWKNGLIVNYEGLTAESARNMGRILADTIADAR